MVKPVSFSVASMTLASVWLSYGLPRQHRGMEHELAARRAAVGGDDRSLDAEFVKCGGFAFADALDLGSMEGIELPATLALLLRPDLSRAGKRGFEGGLERGTALDSAADVANDPAEPAAQ
jgi:hypothetical protein